MGVLLVVAVALAVLVAAAFALWRTGRVPIVKSRDSFEGMYTSSFETSSFVPCGKREPRYWLVWDATTMGGLPGDSQRALVP